MAPMAMNLQPNGDSGCKTSKIPPRLYSLSDPPSVSDFKALCSRTASVSDYPLASSIAKNVPLYDLSTLNLSDPTLIATLQDEWHSILLSGPGVLVLKNMYREKALLQSVNSVFNTIISDEGSFPSKKKGDHFSPAATNARIWNSLSKHCLRSPSTFLQYYCSPWLHHVCTAWLGPAYQLTAQVNIVRPSGAPQVPHRDYHLGFQSPASAAQWPAAMHHASQFLTLQGAIAHSDMPLESGPTRLLPFSHQFGPGFLAAHRPEFRAFFEENYVAVPLEMGDGLFFNPLLFHAAGENRTADVQRSANLLQVSSAFGRTMETVETLPMVEATWDGLVGMYEEEEKGREMATEVGTVRVKAAVAAGASGYPFPTNLDRRVPSSVGMAPESEQDVLMRGLEEGSDKARVMELLRGMREDSRA